jgi:hypothetical protein
MEFYGIEQKEKKSTSDREYFGISITSKDPWAEAFVKDFETIGQKFGFGNSKKMVLLAAVKIAAFAIKKGYSLDDKKPVEKAN